MQEGHASIKRIYPSIESLCFYVGRCFLSNLFKLKNGYKNRLNQETIMNVTRLIGEFRSCLETLP